MNAKLILGSGLLFMLLAVALGAFGAHAIRATASAQQMATWQTASEYHFYHALGLVGLGLWMEKKPRSLLINTCGMLLITGILLFSVSLYLMVISGNTGLGIITPIGGVFFILAWLGWLLAVLTTR